MKAVFQLSIKEGNKTLYQCQRTVDMGTVTVLDTQLILETEQFLERIFGLRFHINVIDYTEGEQNEGT